METKKQIYKKMIVLKKFFAVSNYPQVTMPPGARIRHWNYSLNLKMIFSFPTWPKPNIDRILAFVKENNYIHCKDLAVRIQDKGSRFVVVNTNEYTEKNG